MSQENGSGPDKKTVSENPSQTSEKLIYYVTADIQSGEDFSRQIKHYGYSVQLVNDFRMLDNAVANHRSMAILVDISSNSRISERETFDQIKRWQQTSIPTIFISDLDQQTARLETIRAGGIAFFSKPVDIVSLVDKLDKYCSVEIADPYRVLVVEDQPTIANYYQMVLKMANMHTDVVTDPTHLLQRMDEFHPDLVLMDLYMPEINGIELTKMIRQIDAYLGIPIVFLSSEDNFIKQIEVMSLGADDFLTKPVKANQLVAIVKSRLERLRNLRSFMIRDGLTGLLNHTSFQGQLNQEINRCLRQNTRMTLAMLDLDNFKKINDTYGHQTGDVVLKSFSLLIKDRLRKSDISGRYGGEEFSIIMLDVDSHKAYRVINEIREHFAELKHISANRELFSVTFSGGIATFPEFKDASSLIDAADRRLYAAKAAGRNQIVIV
ncbi:MAG: diguanylate cyclase [Anaerolineaceae bacterium]|nr:diguanylate cyclase [Anaerolineaceae bacterium]